MKNLEIKRHGHRPGASMARTLFPQAVAISAVLALSFLFSINTQCPIANAAEVKGLFAAGVGMVTRELTPVFERTSGHTVAITYRLTGAIKNLVQSGEIVDAIIVPAPDFEDLQRQGKIVAGSRIDIAKTGIGVAVRAGTPKPDVSSPEAFKRTLLNAKSFAYVDPAGGAAPSILIAKMLERIGIAEELKAKAKFVPNGTRLFEALIKQEAEIGVYIINEIVMTPASN